MTRAPASARRLVAKGAATACSTETTRRPASGPSVASLTTRSRLYTVMPGLVPGIHLAQVRLRVGCRMDGRNESGHDVMGTRCEGMRRSLARA